MKKVSILGCGWLGFPLAKKLIAIGHNVKGSTTSESKLAILKKNAIIPFQIHVSEKEIIGNIAAFLAESEILIIDIPPKLRGNTSESFVEKIKNILPYIEKSTIKKVLFISSTSVYADTFPIVEVNENTPLNPDTESGKQLVEVEKLLLSNANFDTTILRFGGLIGEDRHPIHFLAGKTDIKNPDAPVNLIHQDDCIGIICALLQKAIWNSTLNVVNPEHLTRKTYYHKKAKQANIPLPIFAENTVSKGKIISSSKVKTVLSYNFKMEM